MRSRRGSRRLPPVEADRITFEVEVDPAADPISGLLRLDDRELQFAGWVGLAGALEQILGHGNTNQTQEDS